MKKIAYIFSKGRIDKLIDKNFSDDFFYGSRYLLDNNYNVEIIEFRLDSKLLIKLEYLLSRFFSLPLYVFSILNKKNIEIFKDSKDIFMVSESAGFASLPLVMLLKKKYNFKTHLFVMGLFSKKQNFKFLKIVHKFLIKLLVSRTDYIYFLGANELKMAQSQFQNSNNFNFLPFHVDTNFWKNPNLDLNSNSKILFIGNDGNRDFELLNKIAAGLPETEFIFVSSSEELLNNNLKNVQLIKGNWATSNLNDKQILKIYSQARITILPLKNTYQPSGQSVALQSMSTGVPVLISKTKGFWDEENYVDNENIFFVDSYSHEVWIEKIKSIYNNIDKLNEVSLNGVDLIRRTYSLNKFNEYIFSQVKR